MRVDVTSPPFAAFLPPLTAVPVAFRLQQKGDLHSVPPPGAHSAYLSFFFFPLHLTYSPVLYAPYLPSLRGSVVFTSHLVPQHRGEAVVLQVHHPWAHAPNLEELATGLVGRSCAVGWPYLNLALITSVVTASFTLSTSKRGKPQRTDTPVDVWLKVGLFALFWFKIPHSHCCRCVQT